MTKKSVNITIKLLAVIQILALALLAACTTGGASANVCHATGDSANPYEEVTIDSTELLNEHRVHANDIFPVPEGGCPESQVEIVDGNVTICHATGSETNPFEEITVSVNGLNGHGTHAGDIIPVPEGGCPASRAGINNGALTVCHATGDTAIPYEAITVESVELLNEHLDHPNDFTPVPVNGCPTSLVVTGNDKITICHATGSEKNPYNRITVSINGLNGHDKHPRDIIPAPGDACPATKP